MVNSINRNSCLCGVDILVRRQMRKKSYSLLDIVLGRGPGHSPQ